MILHGGPNIYGVVIGVLSLETNFPKPPGHIKNPSSFNFPLVYKIVKGATVKRVLEPDEALLQQFIQAAQELEAEGVKAITGSCGFLVLFQRELANAVTIPVFTSSLIQVPLVHSMLGQNTKVGILTGNKSSLTKEYLAKVGADQIPIAIEGLEGQKEFREVILEGKRPDLNIDKLRGEVLSAAKHLYATNPEIGALVLECTDLSYFAPAIQAELSLPIFDLTSLTEMVYLAVVRKTHTGIMPKEL